MLSKQIPDMATKLRAITVCVDYADILALTLPYNKHQFSELLVVTSPGDTGTKALCEAYGVPCFVTNLFTRDGAKFNKWLALETALDFYGREGWMCLLDSDVLWPKYAWGQLLHVRPGFLYTPRRRMCLTLPKTFEEIPAEKEWKNYPLHRNDNEFAGYSQIFHASDPALGSPPWHEVDWSHAGGADSFFQMKWKPHLKIRPNFEVLHLGEAGMNWMGRATPYTDGTQPPKSKELKEDMLKLWRARLGRHGANRFDPEKIKKGET